MDFLFHGLVLQVFLLPLQVIDFADEFFVLAHDPLVVGLMQFDTLLELLLQTFDC